MQKTVLVIALTNQRHDFPKSVYSCSLDSQVLNASVPMTTVMSLCFQIVCLPVLSHYEKICSNCATNVHLDSRMNLLECCGQSSRSA